MPSLLASSVGSGSGVWRMVLVAVVLAGCAGATTELGNGDGAVADMGTVSPPDGALDGAPMPPDTAVPPPPPPEGGPPEAGSDAGADAAGGGCAAAADCNDGDACTTDACEPGGTCSHAARDCDDGDECTLDLCDPALGCVSNALSCDDGDACTTDTCDSTLGCEHEVVECDDGDACTTDACDRATGCTNGSLDCDDSDACTSDTCDPAMGCRHGSISCDDRMACTVDSCDRTFGCRNVARSCDDGNACTDDRCDASGACVSAARNCDDGSFCTLDACNPTTGSCTNTARSCDDGNACTDDRCDEAADSCVSTARACDDGNSCTMDACNPATGACQSTSAPPPGNDTCAGAVTITASGTYTGSVVCGADDAFLSCGVGGTADVFYTLTLGTRSNVTLDTIGSAFDTVVEIRSGSGCPGSTVLECDDNDGGSGSSRIDRVGPAALDPGSYTIIVAAVGGAAGAFALHVGITSAAPPNDPASSPIPITLSDSAYTTVTGSTAAATDDHTSSACGCTSNNDVWYSFALASRQIVYWHTQGSSFDVSVHIHQGSATGAVPAGACNDDSCSGRGGGLSHSSGAAVLAAGTYFVAVDGCSAGSFTLAMRTAPAETDYGTGLANAVLTGNTSGLANDDSCGSGPDITHMAMSCPTDSFMLTASTCTGTSWDTKLDIQIDSEPISDNPACFDDQCGLQTTATRMITGIRLMRVVMDGFGGGSGAYSLTVSGIP